MEVKIAIVIVYMIAMFGISAWSTWKIKNQGSSGYLLAGKSVPWILLATMAIGISIGGTTTTGVAQYGYSYGLSAGWYGVATVVAFLAFMAIAMKKSYKYNFSTSAEIFGRAFSKPEGFLCALFGIVVMIGMYALQIISGGAVLYGLLPEVFTMTSARVVTTIVFLVISLLGGYMGAVMVNLLNTILIYVGLILAVISALNSAGGWSNLVAALDTAAPEVPWTSPVAGAGLVVIISWILTNTINGIANQAHFQLVGSAKDYKSAKRGLLVGALCILPTGFLCAIIGMVARVQFPQLAETGMTSAAFTMVVSQMSPLIAGFVLAGLWAAVVSTAIGFTSGTSMLITGVLVKQYIKSDVSDRAQLIMSRIIVVLMSAFALFIALRVMSIVSFFMTIATFIVPQGVLVFLMFHFPKTVKRSSCIVSLIATLLAIICWNLVPALHIFRELPYLVVIVTVVCAALCALFDRRSIEYSRVFVEESAQKDA